MIECKLVHLMFRRLIALFLSRGRVMYKSIEVVAKILIRVFLETIALMYILLSL